MSFSAYVLVCLKAMPSLIYKTKDFAVYNKPAGVLVHAIKGFEDREMGKTLADIAKKEFPEIAKITMSNGDKAIE